MDKEKKFTLFLIVSVFIFYLSWAMIIPFNNAPDEMLRFDIVNFILKYHQLPIAGNPALYYDANGVTYATTPYLPFILSSGLCMIAKLLHLPFEAFRVSRLVSVISGTVAVFFVTKISRKLFPDSFARYFTPILFAFIPQMAFISAYTNQDSFMVMLSSIIIYLWIIGIESNWNLRSVILTGTALGLMLLTYLNGYALILSTLLVVLLSYKDIRSWAFARRLILCLGIMFLISGWFFIRNAAIYHGDFLGLHTMDVISQQKARIGYRPSDKEATLSTIGGFSELLFNTDWPVSTFQSFWACFENMNVSLVVNYYLFILLLNILAFMGLSARFFEKIKTGVRSLTACTVPIALTFTAVVAFALGVYYSLYSDFQPQGRYLFPGLIPIVLLMVYGFERVFQTKIKTVFYKIVGVLFVLIDIWAAYGVLLMRYFN